MFSLLKVGFVYASWLIYIGSSKVKALFTLGLHIQHNFFSLYWISFYPLPVQAIAESITDRKKNLVWKKRRKYEVIY